MATRRRRPSRRPLARARASRRWVSKVSTNSTAPPPGLFTRNAATVARQLASRRVSPKGPAPGLRMLTMFINRAGRQLSRSRRAELEKAKRRLQAMVAEQRVRR